MDFITIAYLFESLQNTSKRLEKIMMLRDFYLNNPKEAPIIFDIIAGNYQREIGKKSLGISTKTLIDVIHFVSKIDSKTLERQFNEKGDIGEVAKSINCYEKQTSLHSSTLTINGILQAFDKISKKTGSNSNKFKKEILGELFICANKDLELKYLARLLVDDLRIGVSQGVLKEAVVHSIFPNIVSIDTVCNHCHYISISSSKCFSCGSSIDMKNQNAIVEEVFTLHYCRTPKDTIGLENFIKTRDFNEQLAYILRTTKPSEFIVAQNPRELYSAFLNNFEKYYNCINNFQKVIATLKNNLESVLEVEIIPHKPVLSMLGTNTSSIEQAFEHTGKPSLFDYKYDGLRIQIHNQQGTITLFSRNLDDITKQFPEIVTFIKENFSDLTFVLDSECVGYNVEKQTFLPFQTLSRRILTKDVSSVSGICVVVKIFDILYLNGDTLIDTPYSTRRDMMESLFIGRELIQRKEIKSFIQQ